MLLTDKDLTRLIKGITLSTLDYVKRIIIWIIPTIFWMLLFPQFRSVAQLCLTLCDPMNCSTPGLPVHHQFLGACSNPCPLSQWRHPTISSSVVPFSSCFQSCPASGSFPMSQFFASIRWPKYWSFSFSTSPLMEKAMATHSSTLAWKIPWMEELGRLQSMGLLRVGHYKSDTTSWTRVAKSPDESD